MKVHKVLDHIRVSKADSGGYIAEHHFADPPPRKGTEPWMGRPKPETHVLKTASEVGKHVKEHMGEDEPAGGKHPDGAEAPAAA